MSDQSPDQPGYPPPNQPSPYAQALPYASWQQPARLQHSGVGIAGFCLSILAVLMLGGTMVASVGMAMQAKNPGQKPDQNTVMAMGCAAILSALLSVVGLVLGLVGVVQKNRKMVFTVIGLVINGLICLSVLGLIVIGLMVK